MAHIEKYGTAAVCRMLNHYSRTAEDGTSRSNANIDSTKTNLNYNLASFQKLDGNLFLKQRLSNVKVQKRADIVKMCDWVLTKPQEIPAGRSKEFFEKAFDFMANRYGRENVISAYVHMDETTPHMHFAFAPIVKNRGKSAKIFKEKLCAKEVVTRSELKSFHLELQKHLEKVMRCPVPILNAATMGGAKIVAELKRQDLSAKLDMLEKLQNRLSDAANQEIAISQEPAYRARKARSTFLGGLFSTEYTEAVPAKEMVQINANTLQTLIELAQGSNIYKYIKRGIDELTGSYTPSQAKRAMSDMERRAGIAEKKLSLLENILEKSNPELLRSVRVLEADGDVPSMAEVMDFHKAISQRTGTPSRCR